MASMSSVDELVDLLIENKGQPFAIGWLKGIALKLSQSDIDKDIEYIKSNLLNKEKQEA